MHYVDRQSGLDADAPVLAPPDYLTSRVTVPPSTVGLTQRLGRTLIRGRSLSPDLDSVSTYTIVAGRGRADLTQSRTMAVAMSGL